MHAKRMVAGMSWLGFEETRCERLTLSVLSEWDQQKPNKITLDGWLYQLGGSINCSTS